MTKLHFIVIGSILTLIFGIYVYKDANIQINKTNDQPYVEQRNSTSIGYENGIKVFDIHLNKINQKKYPHIIYATDISNGNIYNSNQKKTITHLNGDHGRVNTNIKSIRVTSNITAFIHPSSSTKSIQVHSDEFNYNHQKKIATFQKNSSLFVDDIIIETNHFTYLNNSDNITFKNGFKLKTSNSLTTINSAAININQSKITASNNVRTRFEKQSTKKDSDQIQELLKTPTFISAKAAFIDFSNNNNSIITYNQDVIVSQHGKKLESDHLHVNFLNDHFAASSNVSFTFNTLEWLLKKNRPIKNKDIQSMLKKKTTMKTQYASFNPKKNIVKLNNDIELKQINFKLTGDQLTYDIIKEKIIISGNIIIKKFGITYLTTNQLIIDIKNELFQSGQGNNLNEITIDL